MSFNYRFWFLNVYLIEIIAIRAIINDELKINGQIK
jgi:hypothetical protein